MVTNLTQAIQIDLDLARILSTELDMKVRCFCKVLIGRLSFRVFHRNHVTLPNRVSVRPFYSNLADEVDPVGRGCTLLDKLLGSIEILPDLVSIPFVSHWP
jgi:hypothetical protein